MVLFSRAQLTGLGLLLLATGISVHDYYSKPQKLIGNTQDLIIAQKDTTATPTDLTELAQCITVSDTTPQKIEEKENVVQVTSGDTMMSLLIKTGIKKEDASRAVEALKRVYDLRDIKIGQEINLSYRQDLSKKEVALWGISFKATPEYEINLESKEGHFLAKKYQIALKKVQRRVEGTVHSSFYAAALKKGVPPQVVREAINALAYDINWQHDPKAGDKFEISYVAYQDENGNIVKSGELKYAAFAPGGNMRRIYRFQPKKGVPGYFNEKGESVIKTLLQTPMDPSKMRVTSKFSPRRKHPILGFSVAHKGVDFGAAPGTAVKASGDGIVMKASYWGHYGNYVMIKHNNDYSTAYAHLSRMHVKVGQRVRQNQMIGNVGSTGRTTGPHLHYELIYRGTHINPQSVKHMPTAKLNAVDLNHFRQVKLEIEKEVAALPASSAQLASAASVQAG